MNWNVVLGNLLTGSILILVPVIFVTTVIGPFWYLHRRKKLAPLNISIALVIDVILVTLYMRLLGIGFGYLQGLAARGFYGY